MGDVERDEIGERAHRRVTERAQVLRNLRLELDEQHRELGVEVREWIAGVGIYECRAEAGHRIEPRLRDRDPADGVRKEEFSGAFEAWSKCVVPEDVAQARADVETALRGESDYFSDFRVKRADGAIRIIRGVAQIIRNADGKPVRMVGITGMSRT